MGAQYAIMRFAKYKGPEISGIEAHNERTKEKYASNPDVDTSRSHLNFHLIEPQGKYRAEKQIAAAGCRTRTDSVRLVEMLVTASPEFFKDKKREEIRTFFQTALDFIKQKQNPDTIISAVVHMDEKTPHMHLSFVPLTDDGRLCAKEIIGNKDIEELFRFQDKDACVHFMPLSSNTLFSVSAPNSVNRSILFSLIAFPCQRPSSPFDSFRRPAFSLSPETDIRLMKGVSAFSVFFSISE